MRNGQLTQMELPESLVGRLVVVVKEYATLGWDKGTMSRQGYETQEFSQLSNPIEFLIKTPEVRQRRNTSYFGSTKRATEGSSARSLAESTTLPEVQREQLLRLLRRR